MIRSMTGFGRGTAENELGRIVVEMKSVNYRYFEANIRMSRHLAALENELKSRIGQSVSRGKVDVYVNFERKKNAETVKLNEDLLADYLRELRTAAEKFGLANDLHLSHVLTLPEVLTTTEEDEEPEVYRDLLMSAADEAISGLNAMREREGERIRGDLLGKADTIEKIVESLKDHAPQMEENYRARVEKRISELLERFTGGQVAPDKAILENEIALYADHACVDEELVRLTSHIHQLRTLLDGEEPVGRSLDFLLQEFNREANTTASKAGDLTVTQSALELKKEIEKVREQIQNIE